MKRSFLTLIILLCANFMATIDCTAMYYGGIPVPGRRVPAIRSFELFLNICRSSPTLDKLYKVIKNVNAEEIAEKMQRNLYFAVDNLAIEAMMGKWYTVIYTPAVQPDQCAISNYKLLDRNEQSASFSIVQHSVRASDGSSQSAQGIGRMYGPDPGSLLISTGQASEPCPYFPIKVGPTKAKSGKYAYLVLTQALKQPTVVLARDPEQFNLLHRDEVHDYLSRYGYWRNALTGTELEYANWAKCERLSPYYMHIAEEGGEEGEGLLGLLEGRE